MLPVLPPPGRSSFPPPAQAAHRIRIGNTELKNWAAMVIARSNKAARAAVTLAWITTRPGHRDRPHDNACRRRGDNRAMAASALDRASTSAGGGTPPSALSSPAGAPVTNKAAAPGVSRGPPPRPPGHPAEPTTGPGPPPPPPPPGGR